jgi:VWFA-related protein
MSRLFITVLLLLGLGQSADAQRELPAPLSSPEAIPLELRDRPEGLIKLDVMVTDATGKPVAGLFASNFRLSESGREQKILSFQGFTGRGAGTEPAVKVIVLIDTLDISRDLERTERKAVTDFLRKNGGHLARPTSVFLLSGTGLWAVAHPSEDGNSLAHQIDHNDFMAVGRHVARILGGAPHMDNALETELQALGHIAAVERQSSGRKLLLWVGPGWGVGPGRASGITSSSAAFDAVCWFSTLLREAQIALYTFSVGETDPRGELYKSRLSSAISPNATDERDLDRKVLAVQSGGRVIESGLDLETEIEKCVQEAGPFYRISFDPLSAGHVNEYHDLGIEVDQPALNAHTNTGYYDQPYYAVGQIPPLKPLSLEEVKRILELDESDAAKASQLTGCELTQRLSERRLVSFYAIAHGKRTREQLRILADASSFLDPPPDEVIAAPPPTPDQQQRMVTNVFAYLSTAIHKLPDYFARRATTRYQETALFNDTGARYQPLHKTDSATTNVRYRNGREDTDAKSRGLKLGNPELITIGVFGPALQGVLHAISPNRKLTWVRWEQATAGRAAVFRASIPAGESLRYVWGCCIPDGDGNQPYQRYAEYHLEIAVDPDTGAILRLSFQFDLKSTMVMTRDDVLIEYEPIDIGGKTYYCPLRSVSITRARAVRILTEWSGMPWSESFRSYGPYTTMLNDVGFDRYHMFRSESRILTGFTQTEK